MGTDVKQLNQDGVRAFLRGYRVPLRRIEEIVSGFDFNMATYEQSLESGQQLFQYIRNPSFNDASLRVGNWFCLRGASCSDLAIFGGGSGRRLHGYVVSLGLPAVEGTASPQSPNWDWAGGGRGGATQIYIPSQLIGRLRAVGPLDEW